MRNHLCIEFVHFRQFAGCTGKTANVQSIATTVGILAFSATHTKSISRRAVASIIMRASFFNPAGIIGYGKSELSALDNRSTDPLQHGCFTLKSEYNQSFKAVAKATAFAFYTINSAEPLDSIKKNNDNKPTPDENLRPARCKL